MKNFFVFNLIFLQLILALILMDKISKKLDTSKKISVNVISKETIKKNPTNELRYYFEPLPNSTEIVKKEWLLDEVVYHINSDSLNERFDYSVNKKDGIYRIITIGDSFTFGVNISTQYNWTELIEDKLNEEYMCNKVKKYEVINLGVGTYDTDYEIQRYISRGKKYNPDLIIWYIIDLKRFTDRTLDMEKKIEINKEDLKKEMKEEDGFYKEWALAQRKVLESLRGIDIYDLQLTKIKKLLDSISTKNYLFLTADDNLSPYKKYLGTNNGYITLHPGEYSENLLPDGHFNKLGHMYVRDKVIRELIKYNLLPCRKSK